MPVTLPHLDYDYTTFLNKTTVLYGQSGSGKTTIIIDAMWHLQPHIQQVVVFCPTDKTKRTYSKSLVPKILIHDTLDRDVIMNLWDRQEALVATSTRANDPTVLGRLFGRIKLSPEISKLIERTHVCKAEKIREIKNKLTQKEAQDANIKKIEEQHTEFFKMLHKKIIIQNRDFLKAQDLDDDEKFSLRYIDLNPNILVIIDDMTNDYAALKKHKNAWKAFSDFFTMGRHNNMTLIISLHADKALDGLLRTNAFISIFCQPQAAHNYFAHDTNGFGKEAIKTINDHIKNIFARPEENRKLIYIREENAFYETRATMRPSDFQFGSRIIRDFCKKLEANSGAISKNNAFAAHFK